MRCLAPLLGLLLLTCGVARAECAAPPAPAQVQEVLAQAPAMILGYEHERAANLLGAAYANVPCWQGPISNDTLWRLTYLLGMAKLYGSTNPPSGPDRAAIVSLFRNAQLLDEARPFDQEYFGTYGLALWEEATLDLADTPPVSVRFKGEGLWLDGRPAPDGLGEVRPGPHLLQRVGGGEDTAVWWEVPPTGGAAPLEGYPGEEGPGGEQGETQRADRPGAGRWPQPGLALEGEVGALPGAGALLSLTLSHGSDWFEVGAGAARIAACPECSQDQGAVLVGVLHAAVGATLLTPRPGIAAQAGVQHQMRVGGRFGTREEVAEGGGSAAVHAPAVFVQGRRTVGAWDLELRACAGALVSPAPLRGPTAGLSLGARYHRGRAP